VYLVLALNKKFRSSFESLRYEIRQFSTQMKQCGIVPSPDIAAFFNTVI
jgi:hypothetical protein